MNQEEAREARTRKVIEDGQRLIAEAEAALAAGRRFFEQQGIDRDRLKQYVRSSLNDPAGRALFDQTMQEIRQQTEQASLHQRFETVPASRPRRLRNLV